MLRTGELDCAIMAEPFPDNGLAVAPLYDEPFQAAVPATHPFAQRPQITAEELKNETMLLLGTGHCFRDHVLAVCPEYTRFASQAEGIRKSFEGSSLETIKYMVAAGMGVTVVPQLSVPAEGQGLQPHIALRSHCSAAQHHLRLRPAGRDTAYRLKVRRQVGKGSGSSSAILGIYSAMAAIAKSAISPLKAIALLHGWSLLTVTFSNRCQETP